MRARRCWLLVGVLTGLALLDGGIAHAAHTARVDPGGLEAQSTTGDAGRASHEGVSPEARVAVETWIADEIAEMHHVLGARVQGLEHRAAWLMRATETEANEVGHACLAVENALTALGRCFEAGAAASPFGPAGPRTVDPPPGADGGSGPCGGAGRGA
jgi:hypothetical protein